MCASQRIVKKAYRTGVPRAACPPVFACVRWALAGKLPVAPRRLRFVSEDHSSLTYEKEK